MLTLEQMIPLLETMAHNMGRRKTLRTVLESWFMQQHSAAQAAFVQLIFEPSRIQLPVLGAFVQTESATATASATTKTPSTLTNGDNSNLVADVGDSDDNPSSSSSSIKRRRRHLTTAEDKEIVQANRSSRTLANSHLSDCPNCRRHFEHYTRLLMGRRGSIHKKILLGIPLHC